MTLGTHAIVGAAVASALPSHPALGFVLGFSSHFLIDAIPHWDYVLLSAQKDPANPLNNEIALNRDFVIDLFKMGADTAVGLLLVLVLFGLSGAEILWTSLWGAVGGLLPDALQFVYLKWKHEPMISLQRFHLWIHSKKELEVHPALGIFLQAIVVIAFVVVFKFIA